MDDHLGAVERQRLEALLKADVFARDVCDQVARILASRRFDRVQQRGRAFLSWVVAKWLLAEADHIKESTIAVRVFGEPADFDSSETSRIRVAAADLRQRLKAYAVSEGAHDPLTISIPTNTYVPVIVDNKLTIDIVGFENWSTCDRDGHLRDAFISELSQRLGDAGVRVSLGRTLDLACERRRYLLHGSFLCSKDILHVNISLSDPQTNRELFTDSYKDDRNSILKMSRTVSDYMLSVIHE